ncbi:hypothetical protein WOLCODRAFT_62696 [Wolfiporia cocos MD-104 SS10]|uniref:Methyltransferase domain-containing protein n=1 Tax=Wolfiporia cocos (strain MD-104) TaxID=742152 RepID=A0A2H3J406_WOLCO|nr:hypothetical protein WOLCODRAFT_62696 [Wolfiporia cocos MD-104 SS10]
MAALTQQTESTNSAAIPDRKTDVPLHDIISLTEEELAFFQTQTRINDEVELKAHFVKIQEEALAVHPYRCISYFAFLKFKIPRLPAYRQLIKLGKERKGAIFLDIGCCFGNGIRKVVADGFPVENVIGSDLHPGKYTRHSSATHQSNPFFATEYWELGHKLYKTTQEQFPAHFIPGDALNPAFLQPVAPFYEPLPNPVADLSSLKTLTPLQGRVSAIHASAFFHLFDEAGQLALARALAGLLAPAPGSVIFGAHGGEAEKGFRAASSLTASSERMFCHSPESWVQLWDGEVFEKGTVKVEAFLVDVGKKELPSMDRGSYMHLVWSVTRL